jgi:hypothetical protein
MIGHSQPQLQTNLMQRCQIKQDCQRLGWPGEGDILAV